MVGPHGRKEMFDHVACPGVTRERCGVALDKSKGIGGGQGRPLEPEGGPGGMGDQDTKAGAPQENGSSNGHLEEGGGAVEGPSLEEARRLERERRESRKARADVRPVLWHPERFGLFRRRTFLQSEEVFGGRQKRVWCRLGRFGGTRKSGGGDGAVLPWLGPFLAELGSFGRARALLAELGSYCGTGKVWGQGERGDEERKMWSSCKNASFPCFSKSLV